MIDADLLSYAANTGFPIAIASYLVVRLETRLAAMENALNILVSRNARKI